MWKNYLNLIGQEQCNYIVILCKNVYFRAKTCNSVQKFVISCKYNLKANKPIKSQKFLWQHWIHELPVHAWFQHGIHLHLPVLKSSKSVRPNGFTQCWFFFKKHTRANKFHIELVKVWLNKLSHRLVQVYLMEYPNKLLLVYYLTVRPWGRMDYESIAHEAVGLMGYSNS